MNSKKIKIQWNDKLIDVSEGANLLESLTELGEVVPHYCYHPGLSSDAVCRMCLVDREGNSDLEPSCKMTVADGMIVRNDTQKVKEMLEWNLQFHLVDHPLECHVCSKSGECGLQDYHHRFIGQETNVLEVERSERTVEDIGSSISLDMNRCILCTRCVRFEEEITKTNSFGISGKGGQSEIYLNSKVDHNYAINLVDICPVGALEEVEGAKGKVWMQETLESTCIGCSTGCSINLYYDKKGIHKVTPRIDHEVNSFWMCDEGRQVYKNLAGPERLQSVMFATDGMFMFSSLEEVASKIKEKKITIILNSSLTNEEYERFFENLSQFPNLKIEILLYSSPEIGEEFDGVLLRSDKNCNSKGAKKAFKKYCVSYDSKILEQLPSVLDKNSDVIFFVLPELKTAQEGLKAMLEELSKVSTLIGCTPHDSIEGIDFCDYLFPLPSFAEKEGTIINFMKKERKLSKTLSFGKDDLTMTDYLSWIGNDFK